MLAILGPATAQEARPYKEGPVREVTFVRIKPGQFNNYMKFLDGPYKANMEAMKKAGLITGYTVYRAQPRTPQDADLVLAVTFANMAALDRSDETDAVMAKTMGSMDQREKGAMDRESMREILGTQLLRELDLK
ncbi:hypothetical protein DVT68_19500 [Dyella solisilvae]|uniref:NIPSNAP domain-containing protein n=2 Tax=Dyella solisilvae TaxID=1920168 RepID=A0A370K2N7_9GAMM|nr:hypothetical protein DVT68_19500 [Dyella solisilvae]